MIAELREFLSGPAIEWAPRLTLVFLIAFRPWSQRESPGAPSYFLSKAYLGSLMAGLILPGLGQSAWLWALLAGLHFGWIWSAYAVADNHRYLEGYWILSIAIALGFGGAEASRYLGWDAQLLLGLCFLLAVLAKISSRRYRDGSFFLHALLLEGRFLPLALWLGGLTPEAQDRHRHAKKMALNGSTRSLSAPTPTRLRRLAMVLTWWTVAIELALALLFLVPDPALGVYRVAALGLFVATIYIWVPVPTFGFALLLLLLVTLDSVSLRMWAIGMVGGLIAISGFALVLRDFAHRRMATLRKEAAIPRWKWSEKAKVHRLEDGRLMFPQSGISLYVQSPWSEGLQRWLKTEAAISWEELTAIAKGVPDKELRELVGMMARFKLLTRSASGDPA